MRANAEKYGVGGEGLGTIGGSAGAHLAVLLATSHGIPELEGTGGHLSSSSKIQAAVGMATPATFVDFNGWGGGVVEAFLALLYDFVFAPAHMNLMIILEPGNSALLVHPSGVGRRAKVPTKDAL